MPLIQSDQDFIEAPEAWPCYPFLPVKRVIENAMQHAIIWARTPTTVYHCGLFGLPTTVAGMCQLERTHYADAAAIVADGWEVD